MECKREGCENEVEQTGVGRPRLFCSPECGKAYWNAVSAEEKRTGARSADHVMTDVDPETQVGTCLQCGPGVKAYRSYRAKQRQDGSLRWRCSKRVKAQASINRFNRSEAGKLMKFRHRYGLTRAEAEAAIARRGDGCDICGATEKRIVFDHCHTSGRARGWLCSECNLGLGKFGDDPERLEAAAAYLRGVS